MNPRWFTYGIFAFPVGFLISTAYELDNWKWWGAAFCYSMLAGWRISEGGRNEH